ncbi:hypothetical protein KUTeg_000633 [Tegillarca granosa]|uniref:Uncharacterized protein n=1 Tax=Tegillarca granosa TaxID=220873 RepID=A0ABQ9FY27_TEGGR|nr:hypothetical protein KUTeg_000633 [Tegillarca granosa]
MTFSELLGCIGKQGSQELDSTQLMRDLYDSMERETDLKDQLRFAEEEAKSMRKKLEELEEENENLSVQLKKMSVAKATKSDENNDDNHEVTQTEVELKLHVELNEQELAVCKKKIHDFVNDNEKLKEEITRLKMEINQKDQQLLVLPEPSSPNAYYEDKIRELKEEADELRWKSIEKDREIERLFSQINTFQTKHSSSKLKRSSSLDSEDYYTLIDLKRQLEVVNQEKYILEEKLAKLIERNEILENDCKQLKLQEPRQNSCDKTISDEDLAVIFDLQSKVSNLEKENQTLIDHINNVADSAQAVSIISRSNKLPGDLGVQLAEDKSSHDQSHDLLLWQQEACNLRTRVIELEDKNKQLDDALENLSANRIPPTVDTDISVVAVGSGGLGRGNVVAKGESREELMDKILDLEEENEIALDKIKSKEEDITKLQSEIEELKETLEEIKNEFRKKERDLIDELDLAQDKNDILSNLLDIVKDRAEAAEQELERLASEQDSRSASVSSARVVRALSNVSAGSDEVFDKSSSIPSSPETQGKIERRPVIHKDWENQFRKRIDCLERLLAEERKKLSATEKKLTLMSTETLSTAMSDDVKLHNREKELLQIELLEEQKHLKIANDQIIGLKERILTLEEEIQRLRKQETEIQGDGSESCVDTPSGSIDSEDEIKALSEECNKYKQKASDLELQIEEINVDATEKILKAENENETTREELSHLQEKYELVRQQIEILEAENEKNKNLLREREHSVYDKSKVVDRKEELIQEQEEIIRQREEDLQALLDQISHRDDTIRTLRELVRNRDERLKEKDDILKDLRDGCEEKQEEIHFLHEEIEKMGSTIKDKDDTITEQENKLAEYSEEKQSDIQTENIRLKGDLESIVGNLEQMHTDKGTLQTELDKAKHALSEAMVLWDKDRTSLGADLATAREKIALLEATVNKKDTQVIATLRKETHKLLEEKGRLVNESRTFRIESEANIRTLKHEKLKLQEELTQKIRHLTQEMTQNDQMTNELERLRAQEEIAYQIQHHEKVLRAEYLAMKVRYETRLENLQKDHLKLLTNLDQLQREKILDKDIIKGVQKGMSQMKQAYANDLSRIKEEKEMLEKHMHEIDEGRKLATELQKKVDELKCQIADQEYERAEILNGITTQRSGWEVEKANMQSKINELSEKLALVTQAQTRTKDMQTRMEVAWETERAEQKRLLSEAHSLALDLQRQLRSRDEEYARERRALIEQLKKLRTDLDNEMQLRHTFSSQLSMKDKDIATLEKKWKDLEERAEKEQESSLKDRADLARRLAHKTT